MGFQVVLEDSDSTVSIICTDRSQHAESGNILSCLSSVAAEHTFVLVQEALARRRRATQVRISARLHYWPQAANASLRPKPFHLLSRFLSRHPTLGTILCCQSHQLCVLLLFSP